MSSAVAPRLASAPDPLWGAFTWGLVAAFCIFAGWGWLA